MLATDMTASGSPEEKLRWAFKMYDKDGSGQILCSACDLLIGFNNLVSPKKIISFHQSMFSRTNTRLFIGQVP